MFVFLSQEKNTWSLARRIQWRRSWWLTLRALSESGTVEADKCFGLWRSYWERNASKTKEKDRLKADHHVQCCRRLWNFSPFHIWANYNKNIHCFRLRHFSAMHPHFPRGTFFHSSKVASRCSLEETFKVQ